MTSPAEGLCTICARAREERTVETVDADGRLVTVTAVCAGSRVCPGFVPGNIPGDIRGGRV